MKCLRKYQWVKLPRDIPDMGKGLMAYWAMLASRAAFRKGNASYCGHSNPVAVSPCSSPLQSSGSPLLLMKRKNRTFRQDL